MCYKIVTSFVTGNLDESSIEHTITHTSRQRTLPISKRLRSKIKLYYNIFIYKLTFYVILFILVVVATTAYIAVVSGT